MHVAHWLLAGRRPWYLLSFLVAPATVPSPLLQFLAVGDLPVHADFVVVFGGGSGSRTFHGAALVDGGYARRLLVVGTAPEKECARSNLSSWRPSSGVELHIPRDDVHSTAEGVALALRILASAGARKALFVSHDWHSRRLWIAHRQLQHLAPDVDVRFVAVPEHLVLPASTSTTMLKSAKETTKLLGACILTAVRALTLGPRSTTAPATDCLVRLPAPTSGCQAIDPLQRALACVRHRDEGTDRLYALVNDRDPLVRRHARFALLGPGRF